MFTQAQQETLVSIHKHTDGSTYSWQFAGENDKIFYVSEDPNK